MNRFDTIILGGGPAGAAAALALQQKGFHTALVEPQPEKLFRVGETVPPAFVDLVAKIRAESLLSKVRHLPSLGNQSLWGSNQPGLKDFFTSPQGRGWHLNRVQFEADLLEEAKRRGIHLFSNYAYAQGKKLSNASWTLKLKSQEQPQEFKEVQASWIIDATGRDAHFAQSQGMKLVHFDKLVGVGRIYQAAPSTDQQLFTLIEARPEGWWYLAALPQYRWMVMLMTDSHICKGQKLFQAENWQALLGKSQQVCQQLKRTKAEPLSAHKLQVTGASSRRLSRFSGESWIAVGDAAFSMDPLSSAGIYKAVHQGLLAAETINDHETGDKAALSRYDQLLHTQFENYLADKRRYYRQETRWSQHPFWQDRYERIRLDPQLLLARSSSSTPDSWTRLKHLLPPHHWEKLWTYSKHTRPAHQIVGKYMQANRGEYSTERLIQALAYLVKKGMLNPVTRK